MTFGVRVFLDDQLPVFIGDYTLLGVAVEKADTAVRIAIDEPEMDADSFAAASVVVLDLDTGAVVYQASTRAFRA